jgi:CDP-diglyceride synthetase
MFNDNVLAFLPLVLIVFIAVLALGAMIPWFFIYKKAGFHPAMGCLMFLPIVNLVMMFILAFTEWPIERELQNLKGSFPRNN